MFFFSQFVFWNVFSRSSSWVRLRWFVFEVVEGFCNIFCLQKIIFLGGNLSEPQTVADTWARRYKQLPRNWGGGLDRNFLQLPGFYDNPSDKTALVSSNDERLTRILYETLNSVETHFLATRNFTWEGDDGRTNNGNGRSGCESIRDVGWGVGKVHRAERERFVVVPL